MTQNANIASAARHVKSFLVQCGSTARGTQQGCPGSVIVRHLDVKATGAYISVVKGYVELCNRLYRSEIISDPLVVALRSPARNQIVVDGIDGAVPIIAAICNIDIKITANTAGY